MGGIAQFVSWLYFTRPHTEKIPEIMRSFYLTLPSNASIGTYPKNSLAHYYTSLPKRLRLEGDWEVGLCEIHYTRSWPNLIDGHIDAYITNQVGVKKRTYGRPVVLEAGHYENMSTLLEDMNAKTNIQWEGRSVSPYIIAYDKNRVSFTLQHETEIHLSECLRCILGFESKILKHTGPGTRKIEATLPPDLNRGISCLYVYTDVVKPRIVGDSTARLLRVVPVEGKQGDMIWLDMRNAHYVDMSNQDFDCIEILICDDNGQRIPFAAGRVVVTLHLREKNTI